MADFQRYVLTPTLISVVVVGALVWIQRRVDRTPGTVDVDNRQIVLRYGPLLRIAMPWACAALASVGAAAVVFSWPDDPGTVVNGAILWVIFGIGAIASRIAGQAQVRYDGERVIGGRRREPVEIAWADVTRVTYSALWHGIVLHAPGGRRLTIGLYMDGVTDLLHALRAQVDAARRRDFEAALAKRRPQ